jgi:hypothetical protein
MDRQHPSRAVGGDVARGGQPDAGPRLVEQCHAQLLLQAGDMPADRRLGDPECQSGDLEAARIHHREKCSQQVDADIVADRPSPHLTSRNRFFST